MDDVTKALEYYRRTQQAVDRCMAGPDALENARAQLAKFGDPAELLRSAKSKA